MTLRHPPGLSMSWETSRSRDLEHMPTVEQWIKGE
jgi:hypothetical protein